MVSSYKIKSAFKQIKNDINLLKIEVVRLTKENELLIKIVNEQTDMLVPKNSNHKSTTFVGSANGGKFHKTNCPYAKNIKPKDRITFKSKNAFLNKGYKPCKCV